MLYGVGFYIDSKDKDIIQYATDFFNTDNTTFKEVERMTMKKLIGSLKKELKKRK